MKTNSPNSATPTIIMGIDPGTNLLGYAFIRTGEKQPRLIAMGVLDMRKLKDPLDKLRKIYQEVQRLLDIYKPNVMSIEAPFYHKDVQALLKLGRAQGMSISAAFAMNIPVIEYLPKVVKKAVTGNGNASKEQVAAMLPHLVNGFIDHASKDATDALGIAVCHAFQSEQIQGNVKRYDSWASFAKDRGEL